MSPAVWQAIARRHSWYQALLAVRLFSAPELAHLVAVRERIERHRARYERHLARLLEHLEPASAARQ